ncbi:MAG: citramalate synthase [Clostridia bacterium]|nr:citramalate synthase [Clostridia bacterium]
MSVKLYDTTLRDGTQGEGISFSVEDKLKITKRLDQIGIHYVEGGWPGSNPKDMEYFHRVKELKLNQLRVAAFGSTRRAGITAAEDKNLLALVDSGAATVTIFGKSWDFHVIHALQTTLEENLAMIRDSVAYLKSKGLEVFYDAEHFFDAYKTNPDYAMATLMAAQEAGADVLCLCDTNGGCLPNEIYEIVGVVKKVAKVPLGIHVHNDGELAVANSIMAVQAGVTQVQGTINGYGERCGNANLCSIIPNLALKMKVDCMTDEALEGLTDLSRYVSELANLHHNTHQPYVGVSAFAHKGGMHVSALLKNPKTYEHIVPELVGNHRRVLVSELSGVSNLLYKAEELGLDIENLTQESKEILEQVKDLEHQGFQFEGAEGSMELLLRRAFGGLSEFFQLESFRIFMEMHEDHTVHSEAVIKVRVLDQVMHTAAVGNGPVNAMDNALRKALGNFYPELLNLKLSDYKVRVLEGKNGTAAPVRVLIETTDGHNSWGTVGVSGNIVEASYQALVESLLYGLLKGREPK